MKTLSLLTLTLTTSLAATAVSGQYAYAVGDSVDAPTTVFSDQDPKGKGPYSGKRASENQAGAGGYNKVVKNPGGMIAPLPRDDQHDMNTTVPRQQAATDPAEKSRMVTRRKSPAVGQGNTADNARLDPTTGKRVLPDTEASSNPGNPNAPVAPGANYTPARSTNRLRGEQNQGAFADLAVPAGGGTPMDEMQRSRALSVMFDQGNTKLSEESRQSIEGLLTEAKAAGPIDNVMVVTWGDQATTKKAAPKPDQELAAKRADTLETFVREKTTDVSVSSINMAKKPGALYDLLHHSHKIARDQFEKAGLAAKEGGKGSRAIVMVIMKR